MKYHDHDVLVTSSLLVEYIFSTYPLVGTTSKCDYVKQITIVSDHKKWLRSCKSK